MGRNICIMNDSFPPQIDGVANATRNYADNIEKSHGHAIVVTPEYPNKQDYKFAYPVIRYPSLDARWFIGYMAGVPFSPTVLRELKEANIELMHCHCPAAALIMARQFRIPLKVPVVFTYHTKYDIDLRKAFKNKLLSEQAVKIMIANIEACDEVWTVSHGAGENLRSLGFDGEYRVMPNGVDMEKGSCPEGFVDKVTRDWDLPIAVPMFLFVGRMFWYKGIKMILDALDALKSAGLNFRMVFVGDGEDFEEIKAYRDRLRLNDKVIFVGAERDRMRLKAWYERADLFLFPSTYDTNGLVVKEAASVGTPSILIEASCAAEGITADRNGFLIKENAASLAVSLYRLIEHRDILKSVGEKAADEVYISWEKAVDIACDRYEVVIDNYKSGKYPGRRRMSDKMLAGCGELVNALSHLKNDDYM